MRRDLKTIGILGGMGPEATALFFELVVKNTLAQRDQAHVPVIVCNLPQVPDRTAAILRDGPSPLPFLVRGLKQLHGAGADFAVMPCISAHYYCPGLAARSPLPIVHLIEETAAEVAKLRPRITKVGLLATTGTVRSRIVHDIFEAAGLKVLMPGARGQERLMEAIYGPRGIKAGATSGPPRRAILGLARSLVRAGAQAIVAGCTEVPLVLRPDDLAVPLFDPMVIGARACVRKAGGKVRPAGGPRR